MLQNRYSQIVSSGDVEVPRILAKLKALYIRVILSMFEFFKAAQMQSS